MRSNGLPTSFYNVF
jgi:hypothetical protein